MTNPILKALLYNQNIKNVSNKLLDSKVFTSNFFYKYFQNQAVFTNIKKNKHKPFCIRIENTNHCNARCYMCPHPSMKRTQGIMSRQLYKKIIDDAVTLGIDYINLHNFGEPLIDQDIIWKIIYAKSKGVKKITTNTNGQLLTPDLSKKIINSGIDEIFFSIDASTSSTYKKIRIGLDFEKVTKNILYLIKLRKDQNLKKPLITVDFLETSLNKNETKQFINTWKNTADNVCISRLHNWSDKKSELINVQSDNYVTQSQSPCRLPFTEMTINWNGTVSLCCLDIEGKNLVGDITKQSISDIWQGDALENIRKKHLRLDTTKLPLCDHCTLRTFWWSY